MKGKLLRHNGVTDTYLLVIDDDCFLIDVGWLLSSFLLFSWIFAIYHIKPLNIIDGYWTIDHSTILQLQKYPQQMEMPEIVVVPILSQRQLSGFWIMTSYETIPEFR